MTFFFYCFSFCLKQIQSLVFPLFLLGGIVITHFNDFSFLSKIYRYDFLFFYALFLQLLMLLFKLETLKEFALILIFHFFAIIMEIFKTSESVGAWSYPEQAIIKIYNVPLFVGFMYSSVGSYLIRLWKKFDFSFENYPPYWIVFIITILSYVNFFTNYFWIDMRYLFLILLFLFYFKTILFFKVGGKKAEKKYSISILSFFLFVSLLLWMAENISTFSGTWIYPHQKKDWQIVSLQTIISWFVLFHFSFILVYTFKKVLKEKTE